MKTAYDLGLRTIIESIGAQRIELENAHTQLDDNDELLKAARNRIGSLQDSLQEKDTQIRLIESEVAKANKHSYDAKKTNQVLQDQIAKTNNQKLEVEKTLGAQKVAYEHLERKLKSTELKVERRDASIADLKKTIRRQKTQITKLKREKK